jgi:hypothetical protein
MVWGSTLRSWSWTISDLLCDVLGIFVVARLCYVLLSLRMELLLDSSLYYLLRLCNDRIVLIICVILDSYPHVILQSVVVLPTLIIMSKNCLLLLAKTCDLFVGGLHYWSCLNSMHDLFAVIR